MIQDIIKLIRGKGVEVIIYEPALQDDEFFHSKVIKDLEAFKQEANVLIKNFNQYWSNVTKI